MQRLMHEFRENPTQSALKVLGVLAVLIAAAFLWARPVNLMNSDLGRHLQNGRIFLSTWSVSGTNVYSYTFPDFPVINHHWGTGVLFALLEQFVGLNGLIITMIGLELLTLALAFAIATRRSGFAAALWSALLALPLLTSRPEMRPEILSAFFTILFLWILFATTEWNRDKRWLWALPVLMLLWVNVHIYFFLGFAVFSCFAIQEAILVWRKKNDASRLKLMGLVFCVTLLTTLINPAGMYGALVPFTLFTNFGYALAEDQTVFFLYGRDLLPLWPFYLFFVLVFIFSWIGRVFFVHTQRPFPVATTILALGFFGMGTLAVRNMGLLGLVGLILLAEQLRALELPKHLHARDAVTSLLIGVVLAAGYAWLMPQYWNTMFSTASIGVQNGTNGVINFFKAEKLRGPIFNNYDSGGGLIEGLYPQERVFVDNRPEAYPEDFFTDVFIPMQEDDSVWKKELEKWKFSSIIFWRHDLTPWGQDFLIRRVQDPEWAPVFVDDSSILLLRRTPENADVIQRKELPKSMFSVTNGQ